MKSHEFKLVFVIRKHIVSCGFVDFLAIKE